MPSSDESTDVPSNYATTFDLDDRPSERVVAAVAAVSNSPPEELPALYDAVDPDALDTLFAHARRVPDSTVQRVSFPYAAFEVHVHGDGRIRLEPRVEAE